MRTAQIGNWTGIALACPRSEIEDLFLRDEINKAGIYFLIGTPNSLDKPKAYIGEGEDVGKRLKQHRDKDFWRQVIVFVSKDDNLTKSHVRYLEGQLIDEATKIGHFQLENDQTSGAKLPEADRGDMEDFLARIRQLLPVLGCNLLVPVIQPAQTRNKLSCKIKNLKATGQCSPKGFVVFKDSQAAGTLRNSAQKSGGWIINIRNRLLESKTLITNGDHLVFSSDYEFDSPSAAAAIIREAMQMA